MALASEPNTFDPHLTGRPQHPDLHRQRLRRADRARRQRQHPAGPRHRVGLPGRRLVLAVQAAPGRHVPQRRPVQRRVREVHHRAGDQPGHQVDDQLAQTGDHRRRRHRGRQHRRRADQAARHHDPEPPGRAVRRDALAEPHDGDRRGDARDEAERDRAVHADRVGQERAAGPPGEPELLARPGQRLADHGPPDPGGCRADRGAPDRRGRLHRERAVRADRRAAGRPEPGGQDDRDAARLLRRHRTRASRRSTTSGCARR